MAEYLTEKSYEVVITREPGAKGLGEKIREILLNYEGDVSDRCESFLFLADRAQHIDMIVNPAVCAGKIVLCDRHTDSSVAYQGYGRGLPVERIKMLNELAVNGRHPDLTFVFDIDVETSMSRVGQVKDRMESAGMEFFNRVREGYLEIANKGSRFLMRQNRLMKFTRKSLNSLKNFYNINYVKSFEFRDFFDVIRIFCRFFRQNCTHNRL